MKDEALLKEIYCKAALRAIQNPLFGNFSWNRVRVILLSENKDGVFIKKDGSGIYIEFLYHQHCVEINSDGRGKLWNPWNESSPEYRLCAPIDVHVLVGEMCKAYSTSIPINMDLN